MNCAFCLSKEKTTKEHLLSKPICDGLGIERSTLVASMDGRTGELSRGSSLDRKSVRLPCKSCNSRWMSKLEGNTAQTLNRWLERPDEPLTSVGLRHVVRWLAKTALVLTFAENEARRFMTSPTQTAIPDITTAKAVAANGPLKHVRVAAAQTEDSSVLWGVGNPTVLPRGPDRISSRAINVASMNLGQLQLWVVVPLVPPDDIQLPAGVTPLHEDLAFGALATRAGSLDPTQVVATYSDRTTAAFLRAMAAAQHALATGR